jgi:predicted house-cleaning noncanonical NTP pyrophosphatase (MazG superfamily)
MLRRPTMTMRHVDIDDKLLEDVKAYLGTKTIKDTIHEALALVAEIPERMAEIDWWSTDPLPEIRERQAMKDAYR